MPAETDDDYVVSLLLKDAEANKKRYLSNSGLGSLLSTSKKPRGNAPKPNTRFLKNIVKEADSHNAALKAKEEEESRERLRGLKRTRDEGRDDGGSGARKRGKKDRPGRWASALGGLSQGRAREKREESKRDGARERERRRSRERSREREREHKSHRRRNGAERSRSRSRSPDHRKERRRRERSRTPSRRNRSSPTDRGSDSDPLDTILGPKPAPTVLPRGRGAHKSTSESMDARFSESYNPKTDVDMSDNEADGQGDDWGLALEALKDRAKWRAQGAERLRAAGFSEAEVERWEGSAKFPNGSKDDGEKDVGDVRWRKKGEGREWDRGKVVGEDGVDVKPIWAREKS